MVRLLGVQIANGIDTHSDFGELFDEVCVGAVLVDDLLQRCDGLSVGLELCLVCCLLGQEMSELLFLEVDRALCGADRLLLFGEPQVEGADLFQKRLCFAQAGLCSLEFGSSGFRLGLGLLVGGDEFGQVQAAGVDGVGIGLVCSAEGGQAGLRSFEFEGELGQLQPLLMGAEFLEPGVEGTGLFFNGIEFGVELGYHLEPCDGLGLVLDILGKQVGRLGLLVQLGLNSRFFFGVERLDAF